jgi:hypothetical protein
VAADDLAGMDRRPRVQCPVDSGALVEHKAGPWMKDLIEIAAHIKKNDRERHTAPRDEDYLKRAKDIEL